MKWRRDETQNKLENRKKNFYFLLFFFKQKFWKASGVKLRKKLDSESIASSPSLPPNLLSFTCSLSISIGNKVTSSRSRDHKLWHKKSFCKSRRQERGEENELFFWGGKKNDKFLFVRKKCHTPRYTTDEQSVTAVDRAS